VYNVTHFIPQVIILHHKYKQIYQKQNKRRHSTTKGHGQISNLRLKVFQHTGETSHFLLCDSLVTFRLFQQHPHLLFYLNHLRNTPDINNTSIIPHIPHPGGNHMVTTIIPFDWLVLSASVCHWPAVGAWRGGRPARIPVVDGKHRPHCATCPRRL